MRKMVSILLLSVLWINSNAQSTKNHWYVGLDVVKGIPSYLFPNKFPIRNTFTIEPLVRLDIRDSRKGVVFGAGYANGKTKAISGQIPFQNFRGTYLKASYEVKNPSMPMHAGIGPIISMAAFDGHYRFNGPVFGNYEGNFKEDRFAIGVEGNFSYDLPVGKMLHARFLLRGSLAVQSRGNVHIQYFPGIGYNLGSNDMLVSGGFTTQLYYRIN